jgi:hypothetical protein
MPPPHATTQPRHGRTKNDFRAINAADTPGSAAARAAAAAAATGAADGATADVFSRRHTGRAALPLPMRVVCLRSRPRLRLHDDVVAGSDHHTSS